MLHSPIKSAIAFCVLFVGYQANAENPTTTTISCTPSFFTRAADGTIDQRTPLLPLNRTCATELPQDVSDSLTGATAGNFVKKAGDSSQTLSCALTTRDGSRVRGSGLVAHSIYIPARGVDTELTDVDMDYDADDPDARVADNTCANTDFQDGDACILGSEEYTRGGVRFIRWHGFKKQIDGHVHCYTRGLGKVRRRFVGALSCFIDKQDDWIACLLSGTSDCGREVFDPATLDHATAFCNACDHAMAQQDGFRWCKWNSAKNLIEKHLFRAYASDVVNGTRVWVNTCEGTDTGSCGCNVSTGTCAGANTTPTPPTGGTESEPTSSQSGFLFRAASSN